MAVRLRAILYESYLGSQYYTVPQINAAFAALKLNHRYINIAYAEYLDFETYHTVTKENKSSYDDARLLYQKYVPSGITGSWEPAPMNEYIRQGGFSNPSAGN